MTHTVTPVPAVTRRRRAWSPRMAEIAERVAEPARRRGRHASSRFPTESIDALREAEAPLGAGPRAPGRDGRDHRTALRGRGRARPAVCLDAPWWSRCTTSRWPAWSATAGATCSAATSASWSSSSTCSRRRRPRSAPAATSAEASARSSRPRAAFRLEKQAPVISYGAFADAVLATARRGEDSPPSDQVLVLVPAARSRARADRRVERARVPGHVQPGFVLRATGEAGAILDDPYGDISTQTMLPVAHLLWSSVWLGIATAAIDRARRYVQAEARKHPGTTPAAASRLAEVTVGATSSSPTWCAGRSPATNRSQDDPDQLSSVGFARRDELAQGLGLDAGGRHRARVHADLRARLVPARHAPTASAATCATRWARR